MGDVQTLIDMGFPRERAEYAIQVTNNKGVEPAMEWLLAHTDEVIPATGKGQTISAADDGDGEAAVDAAASSTSEAAAAVAVAKSLKCDDCGKLCKDQTEIEFHAAKTGHSNFSESTEEKKPLTDEEKKQQLQLIEDKLRQKRSEREEREKKDAFEREKIRIKSGKDMVEAKRRMEEIEMQKIIEQRKREKAEDKAARDRVRAQIEADKAARKAREQGQSATETGAVSSTTPTSPQLPVSPKPPARDYTQTRIQVRLTDGSTLTETFNIKEQLSAVRVFIQMKTGTEQSFGLMTPFPRRVFTDEDFEKPLEVLGLVPSAVLIMTKPTIV